MFFLNAIKIPATLFNVEDIKALALSVRSVTGATVNVALVIFAFLTSISVVLRIVARFTKPSHLGGGGSGGGRESSMFK